MTVGPLMFLIGGTSFSAGWMAIRLWRDHADYLKTVFWPEGGQAFALNFHPILLTSVCLCTGVIALGLFCSNLVFAVAKRSHADLVWNALTAASLGPFFYLIGCWLGVF